MTTCLICATSTGIEHRLTKGALDQRVVQAHEQSHQRSHCQIISLCTSEGTSTEYGQLDPMDLS